MYSKKQSLSIDFPFVFKVQPQKPHQSGLSLSFLLCQHTTYNIRHTFVHQTRESKIYLLAINQTVVGTLPGTRRKDTSGLRYDSITLALSYGCCTTIQ